MMRRMLHVKMCLFVGMRPAGHLHSNESGSSFVGLNPDVMLL